ncbi:DUF397 domain-containing protein [Streptomyces avermitilis]|uniref:DUF397 domain-containing protein n=1 Tax=Streptomyces avermitilis TaxID=33903 RepID=UPI0033CED8A3
MRVETAKRRGIERTWRKSSYSSGEGGQCVEVATALHTVHVRDSKDIARPQLSVAPEAWVAFIDCTGGRTD